MTRRGPLGIIDLLGAVLCGVRNCDDILFFIGAHSVVEDDIGKDPDPVVRESPDRLEIFFFEMPYLVRTVPFWSNSPEVIHVVDAVADVFLGSPFYRRAVATHP